MQTEARCRYGGRRRVLGEMDASVNVFEALDVERQTSRNGVLPALRPSAAVSPAIPDYLMDTYYWAYLNPRNVRLLDREIVVSVILWGQHRRLRREAFRELRPGLKVLQPACVYGDFSPALARHLGPRGTLEVIDIAPIQVAGCRRKLRGFPQATVRHADAAAPGGGPYDAVCCYFLLHERPEDYKRAVVDALLEGWRELAGEREAVCDPVRLASGDLGDAGYGHAVVGQCLDDPGFVHCGDGASRRVRREQRELRLVR